MRKFEVKVIVELSDQELNSLRNMDPGASIEELIRARHILWKLSEIESIKEIGEKAHGRS